ncbi:flagellar P-ring protein FlgI [Legionella norrlandica]|uniref:Flagellar P-ring protein n=1 Tax=Legionella norrlandica TaxID=1498499 RepID=A0A0A2SRE1_9GAMM|nr:flagellar basal body P-ring protein FlgI [Legionella norrlandica]KGP63700.1 flagellar P-ring protein FlgI [Legionella norrlandica]
MRNFVITLLLLFLTLQAQASRIKDITTLAGVRDNQLVGYGLVVGLDGTGDRTNQTPFTDQTFKNMLLDFGIKVPRDKNFQLRNVAAVAVSAILPPFARIGQKLDVTVSSIGNAPSLRGGSLLLVPLKGADGQVYAMAQGNVVVSGFGARGLDGSKVTVNVTATGRIANGATVEQTVPMPYIRDGMIVFELISPDFTTSNRIAETINKELGYTAAQPIDAGAVAVKLNESLSKSSFLGRNSYVNFISGLENLPVMPADVAAKVIINSRSGTIVVGQDVTISPVAVAHGNLTVSVSETPFVSQPEPFARGKTVKGSDSDVNINEQKSRAFLLKTRGSLKELVNAINKVGAAPGDLVAILEAIKQAGALHADLEVI